MRERLHAASVRLLRATERYTKTDMVYLANAGFWTNLNVGTTSLLAFALSIAFANLVPRDAYGLYQYLLSLAAIVTALTLTGMNTAVAQSVARGYEGDLAAALRVQLRWNSVPSALGLLGALYYFAAGNAPVAAGLALIAVLAPLTSAFNTYSAFLAGKRDFRRAFLYAFALNLVYYPAMLATMLAAPYAVALVGVNLATNAAAAWWLYRRTSRVYAPSSEVDPETVRYGAHLSVMSAFGTIITQLDSVLVFHFLGAAPLAVYTFATMIPERLAGLLGFIGGAAFPKYANRSIGELKGSILAQTGRAAAAGAALAAAYALAAPLLFRIAFPRYLDAVGYTQVYALVVVLMTANLASVALQAKRRRTELYITSFLNPVLLLALQIPLLLAYGIMGMIVARLISDALGIALGLALLYRTDEEPAPATIS
ncbi:MAG: oligosaccharide flippase family protein [Patescibacteria group bacterium]|nr:oligosaccharide flippase family protein [Patescibacteria group bacterium]MDE1944201.1 oligosaccharide flippase family protein [Patescibacteria group bacterium]MDE2057892.1 oligosaccharide flippase family protein [Patescibacteria group bacterium]